MIDYEGFCVFFQGDWVYFENSGEILKNFKQQRYMVVVEMDSGEKWDKFRKREIIQMIIIKFQKGDFEGLFGNLGFENLTCYFY